jgi:hypothetical protein
LFCSPTFKVEASLAFLPLPASFWEASGASETT